MSFVRKKGWGIWGKGVEKWGGKWYDVTMGVVSLEEEEEMKTLEQYKDEQMKDSAFAKEYEAIQPEMEAVRAIVEAEASQNTTVEEKETKEETQDKNWWKFIKENVAAIITVVTAIFTVVYAALKLCMFVYWKGYFTRMRIDVSIMNLNFDKSIFGVISVAIILFITSFFMALVEDKIKKIKKEERILGKGIKKLFYKFTSLCKGLFMSISILLIPNIPLVMLLVSMIRINGTLFNTLCLVLLLYIMEMLFIFIQARIVKRYREKESSKENDIAIMVTTVFAYVLFILVVAFYDGKSAIEKMPHVQLVENEEYMISYCDGEHYVLHKVKYENEEIIIYINEQKIVGIEDCGYSIKRVKNVIIEE